MLFPPLVQVFVEAVEEKVEVFLRVLLSVETPFRVQSRAEVPQSDGPHGLGIAFPERADEVGVDFRHDPVGAFPVFAHGEGPPTVIEEELGEGDGGQEALDRGVHIAGAAEVDEAGAGEFEVVGDGSGGVEGGLLGGCAGYW